VLTNRIPAQHLCKPNGKALRYPQMNRAMQHVDLPTRPQQMLEKKQDSGPFTVVEARNRPQSGPRTPRVDETMAVRNRDRHHQLHRISQVDRGPCKSSRGCHPRFLGGFCARATVTVAETVLCCCNSSRWKHSVTGEKKFF
jgi:hypothetical protein